MTIPLTCLFIMAVFTIFSKAPLFFAQAKQPGGYDNNTPREQQAALDRPGKRALAAHQNGFEAFSLFAAGVLVAHVAGNMPGLASLFAVAFVVTRVAYTWAYVVDKATTRSILWAIGLLCTFGLMLTPLG